MQQIAPDQNSLLLEATLRNNAAEIKHLISLGADPNIAKDSDGLSPLYIASRNGYKDAVMALLEKGADVNFIRTDNGMTPLYAAAHKGYEEIVMALLEKGAKPNLARTDGGITPLYAAAYNGYEKIVAALLKKEADVNLATEDGETPLYVAAEKGYEKIVAALLEKEANVNLARADGVTPLNVASLNGYEEIVMALLEKEANPDLARTDGVTPLYVAAEKGYEEIVMALLEKGADLNLAGTDEATPLYVATENGREEIVVALLEKRANPNLARTDKTTPLYVAAHNGYEKIVAALLKKGADVNLARTDKTTPLYVAAHNGYEKIVAALLKKEADVNLATEDGETPLYVAAEKGYEKIVAALLGKGADPNLARADGVKPLNATEHCSDEKRNKIITLLICHGAIPELDKLLNEGEALSTEEITIIDSIPLVAIINKVMHIIDNENPIHSNALDFEFVDKSQNRYNLYQLAALFGFSDCLIGLIRSRDFINFLCPPGNSLMALHNLVVEEMQLTTKIVANFIAYGAKLGEAAINETDIPDDAEENQKYLLQILCAVVIRDYFTGDDKKTALDFVFNDGSQGPLFDEGNTEFLEILLKEFSNYTKQGNVISAIRGNDDEMKGVICLLKDRLFAKLGINSTSSIHLTSAEVLSLGAGRVGRVRGDIL